MPGLWRSRGYLNLAAAGWRSSACLRVAVGFSFSGGSSSGKALSDWRVRDVALQF